MQADSDTDAGQPIATLARWIASRQVLHIVWQDRLLLPLFQFDRPGLQPVDGVCRAVLELRDVLDDWELALWFVRPNAWLQDAAPVDRVRHDPAAVIQAARADRFVARG